MADTPSAAQIESRFNEVRIEIGERCAQDSGFRSAVLADANAPSKKNTAFPPAPCQR
jgi:hypothetical protein